MNERVELPVVPIWLAAFPYLFSSKCRSDSDLIAPSALASAAAAMAADPERRDSRAKVTFLLAELASQYARRTGDRSGWIPVDRAQLARAARINLTKVKRVLGFLLLAGVIDVGKDGVRILDWARLCKLASYERCWAPVQESESDDADTPTIPEAAIVSPALTTTGEPASFV